MPRKRAPTTRPKVGARRTLKPIPKKPRGKSFEPGHKKMGGRKKGTGNAVSHDMKTFLTEFVEGDKKYQEKLKERLREGKAPQIELLAAHYSGGKPVDTFEVGEETLAGILGRAAARGLNGKT